VTPTARRALTVVLIAVGVVLVVIAAIYFIVPADDLPSIMGHLEGNEVRRTKRGAAALVLGVLALYLGMIIARRRARPQA
jgi:hypothetical protein